MGPAYAALSGPVRFAQADAAENGVVGREPITPRLSRVGAGRGH